MYFFVCRVAIQGDCVYLFFYGAVFQSIDGLVFCRGDAPLDIDFFSGMVQGPSFLPGKRVSIILPAASNG